MKKITLSLMCLFFVAAIVAQQQRTCHSMENLEYRKKLDPSLQQRMEEIETFTQKKVLEMKNYQGKIDGNIITIPVVVHVIYSNTNENISDAQILSQIEVLNEDFRRTNSDADNKWSQAADTQIEFALATIDEDGNTTTGITRKSSSTTSWGTNDAMKRSSQGGVDPWDTSEYLNMWVCNIGSGLLGYAQFPGGSAATDGVVMGPNYFGSSDKGSGFYLSAPFDKGRTTTHEVGHFLNLRHIWGDGGCGVDDFVSDTPTSDAANYGCASTHTSCGSLDMVENYMDYSDDSCMNLFTAGQTTRMRAVLETGGSRRALALSDKFGGVTDPGTPTTCSSTINSFPYSESFESGAGWTQATGDDGNWVNDASGTPSSNTGPSSGVDGSFYMFLEASSNSSTGQIGSNATAILESPCFDLSSEATATFTFQNHMYGTSVGSLILQASTDGSSWTSLWSDSGNQGNQWNSESVSLASYIGTTVRLRFVGTTGTSWSSDIAIDDLNLTTDGGTTPTDCDTLNFNSYTLNSFATQDAAGNSAVSGGGANLTLTNNTWKYIDFDYTVTANTVVEFEFSSTSEGEIHGIAFENDNTLTSSRVFKVYGTQNYGITNFDNYSSGTTTYVIPVGDSYTGTMDRLVFINDNDGGSGNTSTFSNVKIYETSCSTSRTVVEFGARIDVLGDEDEFTSLVTLYPNPVSAGVLNVNLSKVYEGTYRIIDLSGRTIKKGTLIQSINVSSLKAGVYLFEVKQDEKGVSTQKFIKK